MIINYNNNLTKLVGEIKSMVQVTQVILIQVIQLIHMMQVRLAHL